MPDPDRGTSFAASYERGLRTSVRTNGGPYGYSVMITASFGVLSALVGSPTVGQIFLFLLGAVLAFLVVEAAVSRGFRVRLRGEPSEVVALGSSFAFVSVGGGVGIAALAGVVLGPGVAWPFGSLLATVTYLLLVGIELGLAERAAPSESQP
jgi:hypothetical protein